MSAGPAKPWEVAPVPGDLGAAFWVPLCFCLCPPGRVAFPCFGVDTGWGWGRSMAPSHPHSCVYACLSGTVCGSTFPQSSVSALQLRFAVPVGSSVDGQHGPGGHRGKVAQVARAEELGQKALDSGKYRPPPLLSARSPGVQQGTNVHSKLTHPRKKGTWGSCLITGLNNILLCDGDVGAGREQCSPSFPRGQWSGLLGQHVRANETTVNYEQMKEDLREYKVNNAGSKWSWY